MTALQIANKSLALLGYTDNNNNTDLTQRVLNRILPLVNLVFSDICRMCDMKEKEIKSLDEDFSLPEKAVSVMACGLAAYIAAAEGDETAQIFWAEEYSQRKTSMTQMCEYSDELPTPEY